MHQEGIPKKTLVVFFGGKYRGLPAHDSVYEHPPTNVLTPYCPYK